MPIESQPTPFYFEWPSIMQVLVPILGRAGSPVYVVGGAVRDAFLRRPIHDLDFATAGDGLKAARMVADRLQGAYHPLDIERSVGRAIVNYAGERYVIDIARFRGGSNGLLEDDLIGRDFTVNALAVQVEGEMQTILDAVGGLADLRQKRLRRCSPESIVDDPVRALRAVRQSVALNFQIDKDTRADLRIHGQRIPNAAAERVRDEFMNMLGGPKPHAALRTLEALGLLNLIVPEVEAMRGVQQSAPHIYDVWEHTLNVVERLHNTLTTISPARTDDSAADSAQGMIVYTLDKFRRALQAHLDQPLTAGRSLQSLLILAALLHDCAKPATRSVGPEGRIHFYQHENVGAEMAEQRGIALRLSSDEVTRLTNIVRHHMRPHALNTDHNAPLSRRTVYRFWKAAGESGVDTCILSLADYLGMVGVTLVLQDWIHHLQIVESLLDGYINQQATVVSPPPLVSGRDLILMFDLKPGPEIGRLLDAIHEAQAAGEITTMEQAIAFARGMMGAASRDE